MGTSAPSLAYQAGDNAKPESANAGELEDPHDELASYGEWLRQVDATIEPVLAEIRSVGPQWDAALRNPSDADAEKVMLAVTMKADSAIMEARRRLAALPQPEFLNLDQREAERPAYFHAQADRILVQMREVVAGFGALLGSVRSGDEKAAKAAALQLLSATEVVVRAQGVMNEAWIATMSADEPGRYSLLFERQMSRSALRQFANDRKVVLGQPDPTLGADLAAIATEMDVAINGGIAAADASQDRLRATIAEIAPEDTRMKATTVKYLEIAGLYRESFAVARRYADALRSAEPNLAPAQSTSSFLKELGVTLRDVRARLNAIATRQAEILAGR